MTNKPWFKFYPADWLADERVQTMSFEEQGIYIRLLCYAWREGSIPQDMASLIRLVPGATQECLQHATSMFVAGDKRGRLVNQRMEKERVEAEQSSQRFHERAVTAAKARHNAGSRSPATSMLQADDKQSSSIAVRSQKSESDIKKEGGGCTGTTVGLGIDWSKVKDVEGETPPPNAPKARLGEGKKTGAPMHVDEAEGITNKPTLGAAIRYFEKCSDYDADEVKACYRTFEATKGADGSWWWGKRLVGDWRAAMESRLADARKRDESRPGAKPVSKILRELRAI